MSATPDGPLEDLRAELRKAVRETLAGRPRPGSPLRPPAGRAGTSGPAATRPPLIRSVPPREIHRPPLQSQAAASSPVRSLQESKPAGPPPFARFLIVLDLLAILVLLNRIFD